MAHSPKQVFIGLTAISQCPKCKINMMPFMNMAMCVNCAHETKKCAYCGKKEKSCKCEIPKK